MTLTAAWAFTTKTVSRSLIKFSLATLPTRVTRAREGTGRAMRAMRYPFDPRRAARNGTVIARVELYAKPIGTSRK